ncbi:MAG: HPr family phosphocarrier protein [Lachnospiraceae bacterium]|jgi:phosphocarrier protein HPr
MLEKKIKLPSMEDAEELVLAASKCNFDIDIFYNSIVIDAKSILGVLSMDLTKELTVKCFGHDEHFDGFLDKYAVA